LKQNLQDIYFRFFVVVQNSRPPILVKGYFYLTLCLEFDCKALYV